MKDENETDHATPMADATAGRVPASAGPQVSNVRGGSAGSLRDEARELGDTSASITVFGGSALLEVNDAPVAWFERWIRARPGTERSR